MTHCLCPINFKQQVKKQSYEKYKPKTIIDTNIKKKKQSKHNTEDGNQATREENKEEGNNKDLQKQTQNI